MHRSPIVAVVAAALVVVVVTGLGGCSRRVPVSAPPGAEAPVTSPRPAAPAPATPPPAPVPATDRTRADLQPVFFGFDQSTLSPAAREVLDLNARALREDPALAFTIEGHCDERGTAEYNQALGERRAEAAREYLLAAGIAASRIRIVSYGKERPFDEGHDEAAWASNRRAHFVPR